jgi:hypothetical protein
MTTQPTDPTTEAGAALPAPPAAAAIDAEELSEAEIEAWAARERERREAWLSGPTAAERAAWAQLERERRLAQRTEGQGSGKADDRQGGAHLVREVQLAAEGAAFLVWKELTTEGPAGAFRKWSRRGKEALVRAGREWEEGGARAGRRPTAPADTGAAAGGPPGRPE